MSLNEYLFQLHNDYVYLMHHYYKQPAVNLGDIFKIWTPVIISLGQLENIKKEALQCPMDESAEDYYHHMAIEVLFLLIQKRFNHVNLCRLEYYLKIGQVSAIIFSLFE